MPAVPITADRASDVTQLSQWDVRARPTNDIAWSPDSSLLAISTSAGIYLYNPYSLHEARFFPDIGALIAFSKDGNSWQPAPRRETPLNFGRFRMEILSGPWAGTPIPKPALPSRRMERS
jgi:hypothetical protein